MPVYNFRIMMENGGDEESKIENPEIANKFKEFRDAKNRLARDIIEGIDQALKQVCFEIKNKTPRSSGIVSGVIRVFASSPELQHDLGADKTKTFIKMLLWMWNHPEKIDAILDILEITLDDLDTDETGEDIPEELHGLSEEKLKLYEQALNQGQEENRRIRLMVVGMFKVGKTSLVHNLVEKMPAKRPQELTEDQRSTEGIDVHLCKVKDNIWTKLNPLAKPRKLAAALEHAYIPPFQGDDKQQPLMQQHADSSTSSEDEDRDTELKVLERGPQYPEPSTSIKLSVISEYMIRDNEPKNQQQKQVATSSSLGEPMQIDEDVGNDDNDPLIGVWDFAGQNIYYSSHHFFLNNRSIYLLLMNVTKSLDDKIEESNSLAGLVHKDFTCLQSFKFWINSIHMYNSMNDFVEETKPKIILIGTHKDKMHGTDAQKEEQMHAFFNKALTSFVDKKIVLKHIHEKKFLVNNMDKNDKAFDEIRTEVQALAEKQKYWREKHPVRFVQLEKEFDKKRAEDKEIIEYKEVLEINQKDIPVPVDTDKIKLFLELQHMYGNIMYFDTKELKTHVILSPQWIIETFKCFITHKEKDIKVSFLKCWKEYKECARLDEQLLQEILCNSGCSIDVIVRYMVHLNVLARPVRPEEEEPKEDEERTTDPKEIKFENFYIVPCQLKAGPNDSEMAELTRPVDWQCTPVLCFVFKDGFMPPAIYHRLLAACLQKWPIAKIKNRHVMYNGLGGFKTGKSSELRLWYHDHIIYARMIFMSKKQMDESAASECGNVRMVLHEKLMAILGLLPRSKHISKGTPFEEYLQCEQLTEHEEGLFKVNEFVMNNEVVCTESHLPGQGHPMDRHNVLKFWYKELLDTIDKQTCDQLEFVPSEIQLSRIAKALVLNKVKEIWLMGIELGITQPEMERLRKDYWKATPEDFVYSILIKWRNEQCGKLSDLRNVIMAVQKNEEKIVVDFIFEKIGEENGNQEDSSEGTRQDLERDDENLNGDPLADEESGNGNHESSEEESSENEEMDESLNGESGNKENQGDEVGGQRS